MEATFKKQYSLRTSDFDCNRRIHISSILDLFQDIAGEHAKLLGCSGDDMLKRELLWVLVSVRFKILKMPKLNETVSVITWPLEQKGIRFQREYKILNENGEEIILGTSKWVFIDLKTRKLARASYIYPSGLEFKTDKNFEDEKIPDFDTPHGTYSVVPQFTHLDTNGHVNNTKYADFIIDAIANDDTEPIITEAQIDYKSEVLFNEQLNIAYKYDGNKTLFKGTDKEGRIKFTAKFVSA